VTSAAIFRGAAGVKTAVVTVVEVHVVVVLVVHDVVGKAVMQGVIVVVVHGVVVVGVQGILRVLPTVIVLVFVFVVVVHNELFFDSRTKSTSTNPSPIAILIRRTNLMVIQTNILHIAVFAATTAPFRYGVPGVHACPDQ